MPAPTIRAIPKVAPEIPEATARVLRALKENVETLYGLRGGQSNVATLLGISGGTGGAATGFLPLVAGPTNPLTGDLYVGDASNALPAIVLDASAAGSPFLSLRQNGSTRAGIQYIDSIDALVIDTAAAAGRRIVF